jgi:phosphoribosylglycinamide formyltransferase-1
VSGRIAVGVSRAGSNLRALVAAARRGEVGGDVVLVFADRECPALEWAAEEGIETALIPGGDDGTLAATLDAVEPAVVVLAGYMRIVGPASLAAFDGLILNTHPSLLPAFPGSHAVRDALAHGVKVTGCTVHVATLEVDHGPILAQEAVAVLPGDTEATLHERIKQAERRLYIQTINDILERGSVQ